MLPTPVIPIYVSFKYLFTQCLNSTISILQYPSWKLNFAKKFHTTICRNNQIKGMNMMQYKGMNFSFYVLVAWKVLSDLNIQGDASILGREREQACCPWTHSSAWSTDKPLTTAALHSEWQLYLLREVFSFSVLVNYIPSAVNDWPPELLGAGQHCFPPKVNTTSFSQTRFQILSPSLW